jgi:hypothetical protein
MSNRLADIYQDTESITPAPEAQLVQVQDTAAIKDQAVMDSSEVFKALGRIEASMFFSKIGNISAAQFAQQVRDGKKYKGLPYDDENGNRKYISTFDEFCDQFLGKTGRYVRDLIKNLHALGPDLYESAERIGFRAKDYRALNALPAEEQAVVKQALESESRDEVLDILQDLAARHQAEKEAAKQERESLQADLDARDKVLETKAQRLDKAETELARLKSLPKNADTELRLEIEAEAVKTLNARHIEALAAFKQFLAQVEAITETPGISTHTAGYSMQIAQVLCEDIGAALADQGIPVDFEEIVSPAWTSEAALADHESGNITSPQAGAI